MRFVRVPPYESGVKLTNFTFSWQNGEFLWGQTCSGHFLNQNEELSKKIGTYIWVIFPRKGKMSKCGIFLTKLKLYYDCVLVPAFFYF